MKQILVIFAALVTLAVILFLVMTIVRSAHALDRCVSLVKDVRVEHIRYFGLQYPYWYGVGQLKQESACRTTVTAFDSGQGVAQFMPKTVQYIESLMGMKLDPYNSKQAIRMQAFYMNRIHTKENWTDSLWVSYQIYNGGRSLLYKEFQRVGILNWDLMKKSCKRNKIHINGGVLDLCSVNYNYSKKVKEYGELYRRGMDGMTYGF
jgi:hypothetical protein